jgi:hypothetical protein
MHQRRLPVGWAIRRKRKLRTVQLYLPENVAVTRPGEPVTIT